MRIWKPLFTLIGLAALVIAAAVGCSEDASPMGPEDPGPDPATGSPTVYVDAATGDDANDGAEGTPYRTITAALAAADSGDIVRVRSGTYGAGETLPIALKPFVALIGDTPAARGDAPRIEGTGPDSLFQFVASAIHGAPGAEVSGFDIAPGTAAGNTVGILAVEAPGMRIADNTFTDGYAGIVADSCDSLVVEGNAIDMDVYGAQVYRSPDAVCRGNTITSVFAGIDADPIANQTLLIVDNRFEIVQGGRGIYKQQEGSARIEGNTFTYVGATGLPDAGIVVNVGDAVIRGNVFELPRRGVFVRNSAVADLGTKTDPGNNDFSAAGFWALHVVQNAFAEGFGNTFAHDPPRWRDDVFVEENGDTNIDYWAELWVDVVDGSDGNTGTELSPLQTITAVLSAVPSIDVLHVAPGTYGPLETFPLFLHEGMTLVGDEANRGDGPTPTLIRGEGAYDAAGFDYAAVVAAPDAEVVGLKFDTETDPWGYFAIMHEQGHFVARRNTFATGYGGLVTSFAAVTTIDILDNVLTPEAYGYYEGSTEANIIDNVIRAAIPVVQRTGRLEGNDITIDRYTGGAQVSGAMEVAGNTFHYIEEWPGAEMRYAALSICCGTPVLRGNVFNTQRAVRVTGNATPDMGTTGEAGSNDFTGTSICAVLHEGTEAVEAIGNTWVNMPPVVGEDIVLEGTGTVVTEPAP